MAPLAAVAAALAAGIIIGGYTSPPPVFALGLFAAAAFATLGRTVRAERTSSPRVTNAFALPIVYFFVGLALATVVSKPSPAVTGTTHNTAAYRSISATATRALGREDGAFLRAIVFGDSRDVPTESRESFRRAGLLHVFAASGFNVTLAAAFFMLAARYTRMPKLAAALLALFGVAGYFLLVGPSSSVTRAALMAAVLYVAVFLGRQVDALGSTAAAALAMLLFAPWSLFDVGWQLSFAGVLGIILLYPRLSAHMSEQAQLISGPLLVTLSAQIGTAPVLLSHFGQLSTVALLANPLVATTVALITVVGFGAGLLSLAWATPAMYLLAALRPLLHFTSWAAEFFASFPAATVQVEPAPFAAVVFSVVIGIVAYTVNRRNLAITLPLVVIFVVGVQAAGIWFDLGVGIQNAPITVEFLDVGQGDATLIKTKDSAVLFDGGEDFRTLDQALRQRGVKKLDLLVLSHPHADHVGALDLVIKSYPVGRIFESGFVNPTGAYERFRAAARGAGITIDKVRAGKEFSLGELDVEILWPRRRFLLGTESDINNNSVVAKVAFENFSLLLPGDIQREAIAGLTDGRADIAADVLKVSHQGADNGTTERFLRRVGPRYAVIPVGPNQYGHPHKSALERLRRYVPVIARTDRDGDVYFASDGREIDFVR